MDTKDFPMFLQPIITQGFLTREFEIALKAHRGYRECAIRKEFDILIGEQKDVKVEGIKHNTLEHITVNMEYYSSSHDLNLVLDRIGIVSAFLQNAATNGESAARSLGELARHALFSKHFEGNTRVITPQGRNTVHVDDIRGFECVYHKGVKQEVSPIYPLNTLVGNNYYLCIGFIHDKDNISTAPNGISGWLLFNDEVAPVDKETNNAVIATTASIIVRPKERYTSEALTISDTLTVDDLRTAVELLRRNAVERIDGFYNCYLDPVSSRQLFSDPDFRQIFTDTSYSGNVFRQGTTSELLGLRFIVVVESYVQKHPTNESLFIRRPIICGKGALIESGMSLNEVELQNLKEEDRMYDLVDGVFMVTSMKKHLTEVISQSWFWVGNFCAPADVDTFNTHPRSETNATYKRAVMIEHIS